MEAKELIKYFRHLGLEVHTSTKARGHQGFYMQKRIDISKNIPSSRVLPTLMHEFAHYVHSQIEPFIERNGGTLEKIFNDRYTMTYEKELFAVTNFVDKHSKCEKLEEHKKIIKNKINESETIIKKYYPDFMRSKNFKEFNKYIKRSDAKYLLKYDRVKIITGIFVKKSKIYSINNIENDFKDMPEAFAAYIRLHSYQKRQKRISAKINKLKKYYNRPTELFARFIEGLYLNSDDVKNLAPISYERFEELLQSGYYPQLQEVLKMVL